MVPGDMYKWSGGIFAKKTKFHDAGGPGTVVSPIGQRDHARQLHAACPIGRRREHVELQHYGLCNQTSNISISMRHKIEH